MTLGEHVERFLTDLAAARGASPHTLRAYRADLLELADYLERVGIAEPGEVRPKTLRGWLVELDQRELARSSIQRKLSAARSFFTSLLEAGHLEVHPATGLRQARMRRNLPGSL
jgi:integrase/recombinase XerC